MPGLRGGVVDLSVLSSLAIDAADIDDAAELAITHALERQLAHVEAGPEIGIDHRIPHVAAHPQQRAVAGDAGVVDQNLDRTMLGDDLGDAGLACLEAADVEFDDRDAVSPCENASAAASFDA